MAHPNHDTGEPVVEHRSARPIHIDAEDARAGEIILRKRWQRMVFVAGLVAVVVLLVVLRLVA